MLRPDVETRTCLANVLRPSLHSRMCILYTYNEDVRQMNCTKDKTQRDCPVVGFAEHLALESLSFHLLNNHRLFDSVGVNNH